jgi:hypothetical protein
MTDAVPQATLSPPRLRTAVVSALSLVVEHAFALLAANLIWALLVAGYVFLLVGVPGLILVVPLLALPTASLTRLAVAAVRAGVPTLAMARDELGRLALRKLGLAVAQIAVMAISLANLRLVAEIGGVAGLLSAGVALYATIVTVLYGMALWPIVCDPMREGPVRGQLRLALAVTLRRPLQLALLGLFAGLAAVASVEVLAVALFLPSVVALAIIGYVVPAADEIVPPAI